MKKFGIIGVGGYIAEKHLKAIKETGNDLVLAHDIIDSVGILDSYFKDCKFTLDYTEFVNGLQECDYLVIVTPNYLHFDHVLDGLNSNCNVICEKPLVLNSCQINLIEQAEKEYGKECFTILQLRKQYNLLKLKEQYANVSTKAEVNLKYITTRGDWYLKSWKNNDAKSGGLETNIGIHLFDSLIWLFGEVESLAIHKKTDKTIIGSLELEKAEVDFTLSFDYSMIRSSRRKNNSTMAERHLIVDGSIIDMSEGFTSLHKTLYNEILNGNGYKPEQTRSSLELIEQIRRFKTK